MTAKPARNLEWLPLLLILLAGLFVFLPGVTGDFIYDDTVDIRNVDNVFTPGQWPKLFVTASAQLYRPMKYLSYHLDNSLFGWRPCGWHWQGYLWHALNGVLVFLLIKRLGSSTAGATLAATWFAIHPVHAEAVVWLSGRASLQSTLGVLVMLLCYDQWRRQPSRWAGAGMISGAFIGFFSKEDALMVFPLLLTYEWFIRREQPRTLLKQKTFLTPMLLLGVLAAVYLALRQSLLSGLKQGQWNVSMSDRLSTLPVILTTYLRQLVWPDPMCIDQPVDYSAGFSGSFFGSALILAAGITFMCVRRPTWARWQFALGFFFITLIPVMGLIPINQPRADRFLYLPSVAGALAVAWIWDWAAKQLRWRTVCFAFFAATLPWFGWRAWDYSKTFLNEAALWKNVVAINPQSYRGFANLAAIANNSGQPQEGLQLIEKSLALYPQYPEGWVIKAFSLSQLGRAAEAETLYRQAIKQGAEDPRWLFLLADLLQRQKRNHEAEQVFDRIAQIRPAYLDARLAAALLAIEMNQPDKAEAHWNAVLRFDPANQMARHNLEYLRQEKSRAATKQK